MSDSYYNKSIHLEMPSPGCGYKVLAYWTTPDGLAHTKGIVLFRSQDDDNELFVV